MYNIGNLVSSIKNGLIALKTKVVVKKSKFIIAVLEVLLDEGYIRGYVLGQYHIVIFLKYSKGNSIIKDIIVVSKPTKRVYYDFNTLKKFSKINENYIISTNRGIMCNKNFFLQEKGIGGECLFIIK